METVKENSPQIFLFGGSFDPFHLGHLDLAEKILKDYAVDKFYFVPAKQNPLKVQGTTASAEQRAEMIRRALQEKKNPKFYLLENEIKRTGKSFTLDTVQEVLAKERGEITLVMGNEVFSNMRNWHEPKKLLEKINCIIVERDANCVTNTQEILQDLHISIDKKTENKITHSDNFRWIEKKHFPILPFSATEIRKQLKERWNQSTLQTTPPGLQHSVWLLIKDNHLYTR